MNFPITRNEYLPPTSVLVGVPEIVEFHILRVGTGKIENSDIFKILKHSYVHVMCT